MNINKDICTVCKGRCCKNNPGAYYGDQLKPNKEFLINHIQKDMTIVYDQFLNPYKMGLTEVPELKQTCLNINLMNKEAGQYINMFDTMLSKTKSLFIFAIRPKAKKDYEPIGSIISLEHNLRCLLQSDTGCTLDINDRPKTCLDLIPNVDHRKCAYSDEKANRYTMLNSWIPYQKVLTEYVANWFETIIPDLGKLVQKLGTDFENVNFGKEFCNLRDYKNEDIETFINVVLDMNYLMIKDKVTYAQH